LKPRLTCLAELVVGEALKELDVCSKLLQAPVIHPSIIMKPEPVLRFLSPNLKLV